MAETNTTMVNDMAEPLHLSLFQDGMRIPPVTSPGAACKRSLDESKNYDSQRHKGWKTVQNVQCSE